MDRADLPDTLVEEVVPLGHGPELVIARLRDPDALLVEESFDHPHLLPYWGELWPSGIELAKRLAGRSLRGARVVELGCGLGVASIAAARAGGRVLATDWSWSALQAVELNARRNEVAVETLRVSWEEPEELVARGPWDLVLVADVLYEAEKVPLLLDVLSRLDAEVWLADPGRPPLARFLAAARERWHVEESAPVYRLTLPGA